MTAEGFLWPHRCWHTEGLPGTGENQYSGEALRLHLLL
jgi:hypothetical protein